MLVGLHTPENYAERELKNVVAHIDSQRLTFRVAIDNEAQTWSAWGNHTWPSVYVIDKQGFVRVWWYGELDWQGAGGQTILAEQVQALLRE